MLVPAFGGLRQEGCFPIPVLRFHPAEHAGEVNAGCSNLLWTKLQAQRCLVAVVGRTHAVLDQLVHHFRHRFAVGLCLVGVLQLARLDELSDLIDEKLIRMINGQLKANCVQNDPFQQKNSFLEFEEFFSLGVKVRRRGFVILAVGSLGQPPCLHRPRFEFVAFLDDRVEFLGSLLGFGSQDQGCNGDFEAIVFLKGVLGIKPMKKDHGGRDGHPREF
mmetsp:Transcript_4439/g.9296  ORF Transcript_4439/g.9296 Transcript_4439/m.9296 type:complete len:218 (-) Transcript_4439:420-1073(-)